MLLSSLVAVILAGGTRALATSANLFAVNYPIAAYPLSSTAHGVTTYLVACLQDADPMSCDFVQPYTLIEGPKTVSFEFVAPVGVSQTQSFTLGCSVDGTTTMACNATGLANDHSPKTPVTTTESLTYAGKDAASFFKPIQIVTNSASLMTHTPGAKSTGAAPTGSLTGDVAKATTYTTMPITTTISTKAAVLATAAPSAPTSKSGASSLLAGRTTALMVGIIMAAYGVC